MSDQHVDPAAIVTWRAEALVIAIIVGLGCAIPLAPISASAAAYAGVTVIVGGALLGWCWQPLRYRRLTYRVDGMGLTIQDGVWWRTQTSLPRARIQHSDVSQGPLQRRYGVATLKLYTAGSRYTKVELEGLRHDYALALRDQLLSRDRAGV